MKGPVISLLVLTGILCTACAPMEHFSQEKARARGSGWAEKPFSAAGTLQYGEICCPAVFCREEPGRYRLELTPEQFPGGITVTADGEGVTVSCGSLELTLSRDRFPGAAAVPLAEAAETAAARLEQEGVLDREELILRGRGDAGEFCWKADPKTGALRELSVPGLDLVLTIPETK